jgi:tricorn protease-like protein
MFRARTALALVSAVTVVAGLSLSAAAAASGLITYERTDYAGGEPTRLWSSQIGDVATQLTQCSDCSQEGSWRSPDGVRVFFDSDLVPNVHIFSSKLDGSDVQQITFSPSGFEGYPTLSPDGGR